MVKHTTETLITDHCTLGNGYKSSGSQSIAHFDISCITTKTWPLLRTRIRKMAILSRILKLTWLGKKKMHINENFNTLGH